MAEMLWQHIREIFIFILLSKKCYCGVVNKLLVSLAKLDSNQVGNIFKCLVFIVSQKEAGFEWYFTN